MEASVAGYEDGPAGKFGGGGAEVAEGEGDAEGGGGGVADTAVVGLVDVAGRISGVVEMDIRILT